MGRNSSGTRGGLQPGDSSYKGSISKVEGLVKMKDPQMYKDTKQAISRYHAVMGVRQKNVKLAEMSAGVLGVHVTKNGKSDAVYLNKAYFNKGKKSVEASTKKGYASGWHTKTNKPTAHTITHELAHATWNEHMTGAKQKAAGKEINKLYTQWRKDKKKSGYGKYAETNVSEFWAETVTKAVHGKADKYTKAAKSIVKKYKL
nr:MAG: glucose-regulated metallo-peptidase M90 [Bacteriophage sp.]